MFAFHLIVGTHLGYGGLLPDPAPCGERHVSVKPTIVTPIIVKVGRGQGVLLQTTKILYLCTGDGEPDAFISSRQHNPPQQFYQCRSYQIIGRFSTVRQLPATPIPAAGASLTPSPSVADLHP